jgi:hypothetical protein
MTEESHVGDIGTQFLLTIVDNSAIVNISSASNLTIYIKKPDSTLLAVTGTLYTDGTDGIMYYNSVSGDLDQSGIYKIQAKVTISSNVFYSSIGSFKVLCNL